LGDVADKLMPDSLADIQTLLARLGQWLAKHRTRFFKNLAPGAAAAELDALQKSVEVPIPDDLRALLAWHNGQGLDFAGHFEQDWDLLSTRQIADAKRQMDAEAKAAGWQRSWLPFLSDDADDYMVLDTNQAGAPVRAFWQGQTDHAVIAPSLAAWLADFVAALERGEYHEDPERGTFFRKSR
jgi:cell wall assembly regulator SMI1